MMTQKLAHFFSILLHPLLMPTYGFMVLLYTNSYISFAIKNEGKILLISMIAMLTFALPSSLIFLLQKANYITNIQLEKKEERTLPFIIVAIFYIITFTTFRNYQLPKIFSIFILSGVVSLVLTSIINFFWKISAHMIGIGSLTSAFICISILLKVNLLIYIVCLVLLAGLLAASRLKLGVHNPSQVYVGYLTGFIAVLMLFTIAIQIGH